MTTLVLVHGFMGGGAQWAGQIGALGSSTDVIAVDLPGFGANAHLPPINRIGAFADWVITYLRDAGIRHYHLLGHSMGGMVAQEIAHRDTDCIDRLVLYATGALGVLPGRFEPISVSKQRARQDGPIVTARRISQTWFRNLDAAPGYASCAQIAEQAKLPAILAGLDAMEAWSGQERLASLAPETLVLWGDCDRTYPWEQINLLWSDIPKASLAVVPNCAHAVHLEKPDMFNSILRDFLFT